MMPYSYDIIKEYNEEFEKSHSREIKRLSKKEQQVLSFVMYGANRLFDCKSKDYVEIKRQRIDVLSDFVKREYGNVVNTLVPLEFISDYYAACDNMTRYQFGRSYMRRSYRSKDVFSHAQRIFELMNNYYIIGMLGLKIGSLKPLVCGQWEDDIKKSVYSSLRMNDTFIAQRINAGDEEVIGLLRDMMTSENNTNILGINAIRAVFRADNEELHKLMCGMLVAVRLQEGLRQAICENADCGTDKAFISVLNTIKANDLIRFPAVKRAVATWCGICWEGDPDRETAKVLDDMIFALHSRENCLKLIYTTDAVHIHSGLWGLSFYDIGDALSVMLAIIGEDGVNGSKANEIQLLTIGYFLHSVEIRSVSYRAASAAIAANPTNHKIFAMFFRYYVYFNHSSIRQWRMMDQYADKMLENKEEARKHFNILQGLLDSMPKKKLEYSPLLFPWYSAETTKSRILQCMLGAAIALNDESKLEYLGNRITDFDAAVRSDAVDIIGAMLEMNGGKNKVLRDIVINAAADKESYTRKSAVKVLGKLELTDDEYIVIEGFTRYRSADVRSGVLELLKKRSADKLQVSIMRMLSSSEENIRLAALDLLMYSVNEYRDKDLSELIEAVNAIESPSERESILIKEITGKKENEELIAENGYGLYDPKTTAARADIKTNIRLVRDFFSVSHKELVQMEIDLLRLVDDNADLEYTDINGEERMLGNFGYLPQKWSSSSDERKRQKLWEVTPFHELWGRYYRESIKTPQRFWSLYLYHHRYIRIECFTRESKRDLEKTRKTVFGSIADFDYVKELVSRDKRFSESSFAQLRASVYECILSEFDPKIPIEVLQNGVLYFAREMPMRAHILQPDRSSERSYWYSRPMGYLSSDMPQQLIEMLKSRIGEDFERNFRILHELVLKQNEINLELKKIEGSNSDWLPLGVVSYLGALDRGIVTKNDVYKMIFEYKGLPDAVNELSEVVMTRPTYYNKKDINICLELEGRKPADKSKVPEDSRLYQNAREILSTIQELILNTELKRGDSETAFSKAALRIRRIYGIERLSEILKALGNESLKADSYYGSGKISKKDSLVHLLSVCCPTESDNAAKLSEAVKQARISDERLIEVAMFVPQWIDIIGEYLGIEGFRSGCCYFMAHTADYISEQRFAIIAKYTPLTKEELNGGCFDAIWFKEVYTQLGKKVFDRLYKSAKYTSSSNKHTRARKFADAALGKLDIAAVEAAVADKRNKDLLLALAVIPSTENSDILQRYEFIQSFLKQSRKFGAQRRQSEGEAAKYAMKNLAITAGYSDETRLTLSMETELVKQNLKFFENVPIGDYSVRINTDRSGKPSLFYEKDGKILRSTPAAIKKNEEYLAVKDFCNKLKEQYSRTVKMFELAMEERSEFTFDELLTLRENPVTAAITESLVFAVSDDDFKAGFICDGGLADADGAFYSLQPEARLRAAHPYDLYKAGVWTKFQKTVLERGSKYDKYQPFRQVFRELYVKLTEENEKTTSHMFSGYQINAHRTVGTLRSRRWIADYEDGLQKIYYDDDIIAVLFAAADWFSPADIEAPTIDGVCFYDRKTYSPLRICDVPDIIYSEVMRDVDLAVSVAYAGGVDPETTHSTIEMRAVIVDYNIKLFGIKNAHIEKNHIIIEGVHGKYSIHLGSGVIHLIGGHQINVVAVSSGRKSKIFLPFLDEDPKTAEIVTKLIMFSNDNKIKDPYIMRQIKN